MPDKTLITLGANIRRIRLQRNLSQEELAESTGLHRTYIGGVERGERNIAVKNLLKIARALDVPMSRIFEGIE